MNIPFNVPFNAIGIDTSFEPFAPTCIDGYKVGHAALYPKGTDFAYGNGTPRSDRLFIGSKSQSRFYDNKVVWVGIQGVMREVHGLWQRTFFGISKEKAIRRYMRRMKNYLGDENANVQYLADLWDLGHLPVTVLSIDEGERIDLNVPGYVIFAFGKHFWITNYLETIMSSLLWKTVCNATIAYEYRRVLEKYAEETGVAKESIMFQGHDFSFRGMSGVNDAAACGFGHLVTFAGTDTLPAIDYAEDMYGADSDQELVGASVVATEHAVATSNILHEAAQLRKTRPDLSEAELLAEGERIFLVRALTEVHPTGIVATVLDSFHYWNTLSVTLPKIKDVILNRKPNAMGFAKHVCRPDSGDPVEVICGKEVFTLEELDDYYYNQSGECGDFDDQDDVNGKKDSTKGDLGRLAQLRQPMVLVTNAGVLFRAYSKRHYAKHALKDVTGDLEGYWMVPVAYEPLTPEERGSIEVLWDIFNGTHTSTGHKVLNERTGLIYGDSITVQRTEEILRRLKKKGFASSNVILGIGSYTYQHNTRDTFGFAVKATAIRVNGELVELYKKPATEGDTMKRSAKGFLKVVKEDGHFKLLQEQHIGIDRLEEDSGELKSIYRNGVFTNPVTFSEIRNRLLGQ